MQFICKTLNDYNIQIIASSNTYKKIIDLGYQSKKISSITKFNELFEGRVKTLHPIIHGGILFRRFDVKHLIEVKKNKIPQIDFVIVNLYPFKKISSSKKQYDECIENIDIGGHALIRSASKNYKYVTTLCDPNDYKSLKKELKNNKGITTLKYRKN